MRKKWNQLAYVGLYSGAGRARVIRPTDKILSTEIVETSALAVLRQPHRFTHYLYVDSDERCTTALKQRIAALNVPVNFNVITGDVNEKIAAVRDGLPSFGVRNGLLSFCFVDPFDLGLKFSTIKALSHLRMDFLVLLMLAVDGRRNFRAYYQDKSSNRIGDCIDCPNWRTVYDAEGHPKVVRFLMTKFDEAMVRIGFPSATESAYHPVMVDGKGVLQYFLAFYSKSPTGQKFWKDCRAELSNQLALGLG